MQKFNLEEQEKDLTIWRYMDLSKFIDFLENSHLFLPPIDWFEDKFEGIHNAIGNDDFFDITDDGEIIRIEKVIDGRQENYEAIKKSVSHHTNQIRNAVGVSCWRVSDYESHAMWKVFLSSNEGVAIKTKISTLSDNIHLTDDKLRIGIGKVKYIDYSREKIPINNMFNPTFYKNIYFEHEKELRLIAYQVKDNNKNVFDYNNLKSLNNNGIILNVDYESIIEEIVVSPYAPAWFYYLIEKVSKNKYNLDVPINWSTIKLK